MRMIIRWLVGLILFWGPMLGVLYGVQTAHPMVALGCVAFFVLQIACLLPGRIRNGYWGASPSTSPWEHVRAAEEETSYQNFVKAVEEQEARRHRTAPGNY